MMHYKKGKNIEEELTKDNIPMECLPKDFLWMHVKGGTKVHNVIEYAKKALNNNEYRSVVWSGSGGGVVRTISCAEILKRSYSLHQVTRFCYQKVEEHWDPQMDGLDPIVVTREIPCIHILLTLDDIDPNTLGYQKANTKTLFWLPNNENASSVAKTEAESNRNNPQPGTSRSTNSGKGRTGQHQGYPPRRVKNPKKDHQKDNSQKS